MEQQWGIAEVAAHWGVQAVTVRSYLSRGQMPEPDGRIGTTPWWHPITITGWQRPGRGRWSASRNPDPR